MICQQTKLPYLGRDQSTRGSPSDNASAESDCLMSIVGRRRDWSDFFSKTTTGRRYVPHSKRYGGCSARAISGLGHLARKRRKLPTEIMRFDTAGLFLVGFY